MPYIETTSNVSIPGRKEQVIKDRMAMPLRKSLARRKVG